MHKAGQSIQRQRPSALLAWSSTSSVRAHKVGIMKWIQTAAAASALACLVEMASAHGSHEVSAEAEAQADQWSECSCHLPRS